MNKSCIVFNSNCLKFKKIIEACLKEKKLDTHLITVLICQISRELFRQEYSYSLKVSEEIINCSIKVKNYTGNRLKNILHDDQEIFTFPGI